MIVTVHPEIQYPCPDCGEVFLKKNFLIKHFNEWHNLEENPLKLKFLTTKHPQPTKRKRLKMKR
jgi:uncharacterized C2H2 Zn-finger protein